MVCVPCIVVPFLLWVFHKYIRPIVMKFWPWSTQEKIAEPDANTDDKNGKKSTILKESDSKVDATHSNGIVTNGHAVTAGGGDKKTN